jgi:FtsH-binding integral membrane protein
MRFPPFKRWHGLALAGLALIFLYGVNIYFMENISPPIQRGLRHWMIIIPGLAGLVWSLKLKDGRHFWLWVFLLPLLAGVLIGLPLSRYRQGLAVLWLPWAAVFLCALGNNWFHNRRAFWLMISALIMGWVACLTVFARTPRSRYERPMEYHLMISAYEQEGQTDQAEKWKQLFRKKFPGQEP